MSSLLRGSAVLLDERPSGAVPRVFGARVLRGDNVGLQVPLILTAPSAGGQRSPGAELGRDVNSRVQAVSPDVEEISEAARVQGFNVGFEQGRMAGLAAAEEAMTESMHQLAEMVRNAHETHAAFFRSAERQVVDLALQIAQKVVEREVENIPDLAVNVIRAALEEMDARTAVRVRVSADDEELLRRRWSQVVPSGIGAERIELQVDERIQPGGAIIETTHGQVDAQLESKMAQLGNALWTFVMDVSTAQEAQGDSDA